MASRRHSLHCDGRYPDSAENKMSKVASALVVGGDDSDLLYLSPPTPRKKKVKAKEKTKKSKDKKKTGDEIVIVVSSVGEAGTFEKGKEKEKKKKRKSKKFRYDSEALGVVIIPDCDDVHQDERDIQDKSGHFSTVTDPTERTEQTTLLDDDDFTAATTEEKPKTSKKNKKETKQKRSKSQGSRGALKERRSSGRTSRKKSIKSNINESTSRVDNPDGEKTFMTPELLSLLMDPAMQIDSDSEKPRTVKKPAGLKKSSSFVGPKKPPSLAEATRRSSVGNLSGRTLDTKTRNRSKRKSKKDISNGTSNQSWGVEPSMANRRSSYSPGLLNLYTSKKAEKPSPLLTRNVKSFNYANESLGNNRRDSDIPPILFLSPENSHCNLNDSWEEKIPSSDRGEKNDQYADKLRKTVGQSTSVLIKNKEPISVKRNESWGGLHPTSPGQLSPFPPGRKGSVTGNRNETWGESPGKPPLSPGVAALMLYSGPSAMAQTKSRSKSPAAFRKAMSFSGALKISPSLLRKSFADFKKSRDTKELKDIPDLGA